ncbi:MAG: hypothetical protein ACRDNZ_24625 [Streptosporangiaceae bacterium]
MSGDDLAGVDFPAGPDGRRSTSAVGRAVVADALRPADAAGARQAELEANWRTGYITHFRALVEAGLGSADTAASMAAAGLDSLYGQMLAADHGGTQSRLADLLTAGARRPLATVRVTGTATAQEVLAVPYRGELLAGDALARRLAAWVTAGTVEPSFAAAIAEVACNPGWLHVPGKTVAVLGAGAEMGPAGVLLSWGARVMAIDLPRPAIWERLLTAARDGTGTLLVPVAKGPGQDAPASLGAGLGADLARHAGADLVADVPAAADWLAAADGPLVLGNYAYADGAGHVRVAAAVDVLTRRVQARRDDVALAFLATPTDVFAVPADAVAHAERAYAARSAAVRLSGGSLRLLSRGRLLCPAYQPGASPGINDSLFAQQGPNYALAKRLQRWRATVARRGGTTVSINIAPPTRTQSVLKNRALAAAYAGAHRFGVEVFEPATSQVLMAALLVHDLNVAGPPDGTHPWEDEAHAASHGGLWRMAYAPRSALSLAAALGFLSAR